MIGIMQSIGVSLLKALITRIFVKNVLLALFEAEARAYRERALKTEDKSDDVRAAAFLKVVEALNEAWS